MRIRIPLIAAYCAALAGCATTPGISMNRESTAPCGSTDSMVPATLASVTPLAAATSPEPDAIEERARQAYATGRWDVAEAYYLQLARLQPKQADPWFQLGNLYTEQGRLDAAEWAYREALRYHDDVRSLHNLGLVQIRLGASALREAQKQLPPNDPTHQQTREFLQMLLEAMTQ
ncbi:MAG: tetratricopeptide repeat protein [Phycisphaerales bacterium]|nr:tetratricopeptide repeat protein [Phycisphaerales bacterium]